MDKKNARECAMKLIYEWEMGGDGGEDTRLGLLEVNPEEDGSEFMNRLCAGVIDNAAELDRDIAPFLKGWTIERLSRVDLAILRLATFEMTRKVTPVAIAINEAVELANHYSTDKAGAFINGVLGNLARSLKPAEK